MFEIAIYGDPITTSGAQVASGGDVFDVPSMMTEQHQDEHIRAVTRWGLTNECG